MQKFLGVCPIQYGNFNKSTKRLDKKYKYVRYT